MNKALKTLTDLQLLHSTETVVTSLRRVDVSLLEHLGEVEVRELHLKDGYSSLFKMCTEKYFLSEASAYRRVAAVRLLRKFPSVKVQLLAGEVSMCTLAIVASKLNELPDDAARGEMLLAIRGKSKSQVEELLAQRIIGGLLPKRDVIRPVTVSQRLLKLTTTSPAVTANKDSQSLSPATMQMPQPDEVSFRIAFTASSAFRKKLERARDLLKHKHPNGNLENILDEALDHLLKAKNLLEKKPRTVTKKTAYPRTIPAAVRRLVLARDGGQCVFTGAAGHRCRETGGLEFEHKVPFAVGGSSNDPRNIELLCRSHNGWRARQVFSKSRNLSGNPGVM